MQPSPSFRLRPERSAARRLAPGPFFFALSLLVLLAASAAPAGRAGAQPCEPLPKVPWWGNATHDKMVRYVRRKYGGDWRAYLRTWERQLERLEDILARGSSAVVRGRAERLSGPRLAAYIEKVRKRLAVTRCLAAAQGFTDLMPATGDEQDQAPSRPAR